MANERGQSVSTFILLDTSQLIRLCDGGKIRILSSPDFAKDFGLPFVTMHNLIEMAGTSNFSLFMKRLSMLSEVEGLHTLNFDNKQLPGSVADLTTYEIQGLLNTGTGDYSQVVEHIRLHIKPLRLTLSNAEAEVIYRSATREKKKGAFLSTLNIPLLNPMYDIKVSELKGLVLNYRDKTKASAFVENYRKMMLAKGVDQDTASEMAAFFVEQLKSVQAATPDGSSIIEWIEGLVGEAVDETKSVDYYMRLNLFRKQLRNASKLMGIDYGRVRHLRVEDSHVQNLSYNLKRQVEIVLMSDKRRKVETSNMTDNYFALYSIFIEVYLDKRAIDIVQRVNRKLQYELTLRPVTYEFGL